MKKLVILALSCVLVAGMFAGCRRNSMDETMMPSSGENTTASTAKPTTQTTQPTVQTTRPTESTRETTMPGGTEMPGTVPSGSGNTDNTRGARPRY